jgi:hypothetical protein
MSTEELSRSECANCGFRLGLFSGAALGFLLCLLCAVVNTVELHKASEDIGGGPPGFLAHMEYLMSFPGGIALVIGGIGVFAVLGGAFGVVVAKVLYRISH